MSVEKATDPRVEAGTPATMGSELTSRAVAFSYQGHLPALTIDQFIEQSPRVAHRLIDLDKKVDM